MISKKPFLLSMLSLFFFRLSDITLVLLPPLQSLNSSFARKNAEQDAAISSLTREQSLKN